MKFNILIVFLIFSGPCFGQSLPKIDLLVKREIKSGNIAALTAAIMDSGSIVHMSANGFRNLEKNLRASVHTPFHIASVSKTVANMIVFKLVESKTIDLKTDINTYLPFEDNNPHYPNDIKTVRALLNHRSRIKDNYDIYKSHWNKPKDDSKLELKEFSRDDLNIHGTLYNEEYFESNSNYKSISYSNIGVALLGLIVETISRITYEKFCQITIFKPIEMANTSWFLTAINNHLHYTHGGRAPSVQTIVIMDVVEKKAIIIFTNSKYNHTNLTSVLKWKCGQING
jgi:CubicO group peptidase (beta-lactamase class C family)